MIKIMPINKGILNVVVWMLLTSIFIQIESLKQHIEQSNSTLTKEGSNLKKEPVSKPMQIANVEKTTFHSVIPSSSFDIANDNLDSIGEVDGEETPRIIYDQRQSGRYNVHIVIKDVAIIEMDRNKVEDYIGNDYYYDDADLTVKPLPLEQLTTSSSTESTTVSNSVSINDTTTISSTQKLLVSSFDINVLRSNSNTEPINAFHSITKDYNSQIAKSNPKIYKPGVQNPHHKASSHLSLKRQSETTPSVLKAMQQPHVYHQRRCRSKENCKSSNSIKKLRKFSGGKTFLNRLLRSLINLPFYQKQDNIDQDKYD